MIHTKDIMLHYGMKIIRSASNNVIVANRLSRCHIPNYYSMASLSCLSQNNSLLSSSSNTTKQMTVTNNDNDEQTNITKRYMTVLSKQSKVEYKKSVSIYNIVCLKTIYNKRII